MSGVYTRPRHVQQGWVDITSLVTARFALDRVEEAVRAGAAARTGLKVMVEPGAVGGASDHSVHTRHGQGVPGGNPTTDEPLMPVTASSEHAVVFDNDGVLVDSEPLWIRARKSLVHEANGRWLPEANTAMMGISSDQWSVYMRDRLGVAMPPSKIRDEVIARMIQLYRTEVPLLPGARAAVETISRRWRLGVASGSDRILLDTVLSSSGLEGHFAATVSGDEVAEGKPSPLIYLTACRRLRCSPEACVAIEDSASGIASALAADMKVIAVPRPGFEPPPAVLERAVAVLPSLTELDPDLIAAVLSA